MDMSSYMIPNNLRYSREHEWIKVKDDIVEVGITEYAVKSLHDVVYVSLPEVGSKVEQNGVVTTIESIKAVSEVYSPVSGVIVEVNKILDMSPQKINESPYGEGWIFKLKPTNLNVEIEKLMTDKQYISYLESL